MSVTQPTEPTASPSNLKPTEQPINNRYKRSLFQVLILLLLAIPIVVVWQLLNASFNNTNPTVVGHPLSNPKTHLHTVAQGGKPDVLYLGTHFGLFISTDGGRTWPQQRGLLNTMMILTIAVSPTNPQVLAVIGHPTSGLANEGGIYFSLDGGQNWQSSGVPTGLSPAAYLFTIEAGSGSAGHFYAFYVFGGWFETRDMGVHWYPITNGTLSNMQTPSLLTDPTDPNHLLLGGEQGLYESRDDGSHWKQIPAVGGNVLNVVASNTTPRLIFCATDHGIYRWREGSSQITQLGNLPQSVSSTRLVSSADGNILYAVSGADLWSSNTSGTSWKHRWQFDRSDLISFLVDPTNPHHLYAGFFQPGSVISSMDGGSSWQTVTG